MKEKISVPFAGRYDLLSSEDLCRSTQTRTQRGVDGSPVPGDVSVLAGKVEGILDWHGEIIGSGQRSCGRIAVCAKTVGVGLPVVGVEACQQRGKIVAVEDCSERGKCLVFQASPLGSAAPVGRRRARGPATQPVNVGDAFGAAVHQVGGVLSCAKRKLRFGEDGSQKRSRKTSVMRVAVPMASLRAAATESCGSGMMRNEPD